MAPRHLIADPELQVLYETRLPRAPKFETLDAAQKAEVRLYFESRGILWNPRWGLTGRMSAYGALRGFTLAEEADTEEDTEEKDDEEEKEDKEPDKEEEGEGDSTGTAVDVDDEEDAPDTDDDEEEVQGSAPPRTDEVSLHAELDKLKDAWNQSPGNRPQILARARKLLTPTAEKAIRTVAARAGAKEVSPDDVDDLVSRTFSTWIEKLQKGEYSFGKPEDNQVAVITTTAVNLARTWGRDKMIHKRLAPTGSLEEPLGHGEEGDERHVSDVVPDIGLNPHKALDREERSKASMNKIRSLEQVISKEPDLERRSRALPLFRAILATQSDDDRTLADHLTKTTGKPWSKHNVVQAKRALRASLFSSPDPRIQAAVRLMKMTEGAQLLEDHPYLKCIFEGIATIAATSDRVVEQYSRFAIL